MKWNKFYLGFALIILSNANFAYARNDLYRCICLFRSGCTMVPGKHNQINCPQSYRLNEYVGDGAKGRTTCRVGYIGKSGWQCTHINCWRDASSAGCPNV